jgi:hypothetical protein
MRAHGPDRLCNSDCSRCFGKHCLQGETIRRIPADTAVQRLTEQFEVVESVDYQQCVDPDTTVDNVDKVSPRFLLYSPQDTGILDKKKPKNPKEARNLSLEIQPNGVVALLKVQNTDFGMVELIQPMGAGGSIVAIEGLNSDVNTDGGNAFFHQHNSRKL